MAPSTSSGLLILDKPAGITSYDCIRHLKRHLHSGVKIGHSGTLDPFATGVMIIGVGREATKHLSTFLDLTKVYRVVAKFGELHDTLDKMGVLVHSENSPVFSRSQIETVVSDLVGTLEQVPPIYSALKFEGKPIYSLARSGAIPEEKLKAIIQTKKRLVQVHHAELLSFTEPLFTLRVHVSSGTYIRSIVRDIAAKLGTCASSYELERESCGPFTKSEALSLSSLNSPDNIKNSLISAPQALARAHVWRTGTSRAISTKY